ncbi:MAG: metalloprotease family protein [Clostridiales Family XIII bacterium]|jgi:acyl carrier protein|nr:metalloprotease family protein [Clostridiales Family XIII bacterium]
MKQRKIIKIINEKLTAFGFDTPESVDVMSSVSYLAIIVELEEAFGVEFPDELLADNAFRDLDALAKVIQNLLPKGKNVFGNIKIVQKKDFKYKEIDASFALQNKVIRMKYGWFAVLVGVILVPLMIYAVYRISMHYIQVIGDSRGFTKIGLVFILVIVYMLSIIITSIIHELLHFIAIPHTVKKNSITYIVLELPRGIGVVNFECKSKLREVFISICPFIFLSGFFIICRLLINNTLFNFFFLLSLAMNIGSSYIDVIRAIYIMLKAPSNAKIFLGYILVPIGGAQMS